MRRAELCFYVVGFGFILTGKNSATFWLCSVKKKRTKRRLLYSGTFLPSTGHENDIAQLKA